MVTLDVPCFRYLGEDFSAHLNVEDDIGGERLVLCPVRQRLFRLTPEEGVRQALIWFLLEGSDRAVAFREYIRFGVEESSHDLIGYYAGNALNDSFRPTATVAIVETKRQEEDLAGHDGQLKTYLRRDRCRSGLLFNGRQATWLTLGGDFADPHWTAEPLQDLSEAEERIERAGQAVHAHLVQCGGLFEKAARGDFNTLLLLVLLFSHDPGLTFGLSVRSRGSLGLVQACGPRVADPNTVTYRALGVTSRNRQQLARDCFHALISIRGVYSS